MLERPLWSSTRTREKSTGRAIFGQQVDIWAQKKARDALRKQNGRAAWNARPSKCRTKLINVDYFPPNTPLRTNSSNPKWQLQTIFWREYISRHFGFAT